ncbi:Nucleus export protein Brr6 [Metarhizium brunneum]
MEARSYEGPMDWEYQDKGPLDPTSPFAQAAKNIQRNNLGSPFKTARPPNPFAHLQSPSKSQSNTPQTSRFTPQLSSRNTAPPFRNPAFTTPRKPVDEVVFSEASGAEDSPAGAEVSDYPNDTPEVDRKADISMGATITPLKIDKSSRYGKSSSKKHISGKGEIRAHRDLNVTMRKRKRHNLDKDVGSISRHGGYEGDSWSSDSDSDAIGTAQMARSRSKGKGNHGKQKGYFESLFYALNKYPNTPDHMQRWMQLGANVFLVSVLTYVSWSVVSTIRTDISNANMAAHQKIVSTMDACRHDYTINDCANNNKPALNKPCSEWYECMMQDPDAIMRVKVTAKQVAEIINEFTETMHLKAWGVIVAIIVICSTVNLSAFSRSHGHREILPTPSQPAGDVQDHVRSPGITPGYMLVPVQTPRMKRQALLDEGTDTDNSPINMKPYYTPSGRRSPSKGDRQLSPIKYGRSPSKGY